MEPEFTDHERAVMEKMTPQHRALMAKLNPQERKSFAANVTAENIEKIQSWIGSDERIEAALFWVKGGKFDAAQWQALAPMGERDRALWEAARAHYADLRAQAVESQRRSDLTLFSQFNPGLLFNGLAPALRCGADGAPAENGARFKGVEFRLIGSVGEAADSVVVMPAETGYVVGYGAWANGAPSGAAVYGADNYSLLQLAQLIDRRLSKAGFAVATRDGAGREAAIDARAIRKEQSTSVGLGWGPFVTLSASKTVPTVEAALEAADHLSTFLYDRFGLERECVNIDRRFGNFFILRDENFDEFINERSGKWKGLVLLTATLVCRRCRREIQAFYELARAYPAVRFALVNLNSPLFKFYARVFADMGGGDPEEFRRNAAGVTPFTIVYAPDESGALTYRQYYGTGKSDAPPAYEEQARLIERHAAKR